MKIRRIPGAGTLSFLQNAAEQALYPSRCPSCRRALPFGEETKLCSFCRERLPWIGEERCLLCGQKTEEGEELCRECRGASHRFDQARALFLYNEDTGRMILDFKNRGEKEIGRWLGREMAESFRESLPLWRADCIVPVPITRSKKRKRGYNQAEVLAEILGEEWKIPVERNLLLRVREGEQQKKLSLEERMGNLKGVFALSGPLIKGARVLLVDDVITTGSTADTCAALLKEAGAEKVFVAAAAR